MRRFSQKNQLVTLNEINVTPLLDLAFVLLIIFVITRPLLEQSMDLKVPSVGKLEAAPKVDPKDVRTVEIDARGYARFSGRPVAGLAALEQALVAEFQKNPKLAVEIRADGRLQYEAVAQVMAACMRNGITRVRPVIAE